MSRTNPWKTKKRQAKRTLLVLGEGLGEEMFLKYLRGLYSYEKNIHIDIKKGTGGTACRIVMYACKIPGGFNRKIVMLDNDKPKKEITEARLEAKKRNIELFENTPCLESLLLSILGINTNDNNSKWCKREFESKYLNEEKRCEQKEYLKLFPIGTLNDKRIKIPGLNKLICIMEGK